MLQLQPARNSRNILPGLSQQSMPSLFKLPLIITVSVIINVLLFLLIHQLVTNEIVTLPEFENLNWIEFVKLEETPPEEKLKETRPEEPPPPEENPPPPELAQPDVPKPEQVKINVPAPEINVPFAVDGVPYLGDYLKSSQGKEIGPVVPEIATDVVPTTRIEPMYPPRALRAGIEGSVTVEFTIATDGSVKDIQIVQAEPANIFNQSVLQAVKRWKFAPEIVDGSPVEKRARQDIKFTLKK